MSTHDKAQTDTHRASRPAALAYSVEEAAQLIGVSRRTMYKLIDGRQIRSKKICARRVIPHAELERLLQGDDVA